MRHLRNAKRCTTTEFQDLIYAAVNFGQSNMQVHQHERIYGQPNVLIKHLQILPGTNKDKRLFVQCAYILIILISI